MKGESSGSNDDPGDSPFEKEKTYPALRAVPSGAVSPGVPERVPFLLSLLLRSGFCSSHRKELFPSHASTLQ